MKLFGLRPAFFDAVLHHGDQQTGPCAEQSLLPAGAGATGVVVRQIDRNWVRVGNLHACLLALALAGCKTVHTLDAASHTDAASAAEVSTHEIISTGPEHIVMTVEEYDQLCPGEATPGASTPRATHEAGTPGVNAAGGRPEDSSPSVKGTLAQGSLIRRTVTVTDRGPSLDDLRSLSSLQSKVNTALELKEEKKSGPAGLLGLFGGLWPVALIGGAVLAGVVVWKLKPPWLSVIFKLLGRGS